ncbi:MAG: metallophosphoesterase, partial [Prolixibacteraceae bacterium]|nr:metallophosphoesterase [Prolixibacteraceae bacterium]
LEDENGNDLKNQKIWLDSILTTNTKDWVIITTHLPFYSPKENRDNSTLRKHFQPILEKHGVDMVLTGHDHSYGRGMATDNPDMKPSIIYVVSVSGPKLYEAGNKEWMQQKGSFLQLYQTIRINDDVLEYEAFTANGTLFDKFILKKQRSGNNKMIEMKPQTN